MNENQQPSLQQEKKDRPPVQEAYEGKMKAESFIGLMQANHLLLP